MYIDCKSEGGFTTGHKRTEENRGQFGNLKAYHFVRIRPLQR